MPSPRSRGEGWSCPGEGRGDGRPQVKPSPRGASGSVPFIAADTWSPRLPLIPPLSPSPSGIVWRYRAFVGGPRAGWERESHVSLELRNVVKRVGAETHIHEVNLKLAERGFNILLGATLAGKTTLMQLMAGLDHPTSG